MDTSNVRLRFTHLRLGRYKVSRWRCSSPLVKDVVIEKSPILAFEKFLRRCPELRKLYEVNRD